MNSTYFTPQTTGGCLTGQVTEERAVLGTYNVWEEVTEQSTQISGEHELASKLSQSGWLGGVPLHRGYRHRALSGLP